MTDKASDRISRKELDALVSEFAAMEGPVTGLARALCARVETGYCLTHVRDLISIRRGTQRPKYERRGPKETIKIDAPETGEKYSVENNTYKWTASKGAIELPVEKADLMFYEYSRHGLDLSQSQMRQRHNLKIWQWNAIKNTLFMYKDSNIISPHTEENTPEEELQKTIDERMKMKMQDKQRLIEQSYEKELRRQYKQTIETSQIDKFAVESLIDELNDLSEQWKCKPATLKRTPDFKTERKWIVAAIADIHAGARSEGLKLTPDCNSATIRAALDKTAKRINAMNASDVSLLILGDIIESFTGLNHPDSWKSVEFGITGAKAIKEAMSILEEFIAKIDNLKEITGVAGNHDRITASSKEDRQGQAAEIIFYLLQRLYGQHVKITYEPLVASAQIDGIQYILSHNDKKTIRDGKQAILDHGDNKLFNVVIGAHVHNRKILEDERQYRWIIAPAIFTGNYYSEENAWHARPGFLTFENDGTGLPIVTDHTL